MKKLVLMTAVLFLTGYVQAMAQNASSSESLTSAAWGALEHADVQTVKMYVDKTVDLYGAKAKEMQASLKEYPYESKNRIASFWALNDVGTSLFILGEAYQKAGLKDEARKAYNRVINEYSYAQCWDNRGWFWKVAIAAKKNLKELDK